MNIIAEFQYAKILMPTKGERRLTIRKTGVAMIEPMVEYKVIEQRPRWEEQHCLAYSCC